jgi:ribosomal subunit interface protein
MQQSLQITFKDIPHSAAVAERILFKINKLDKFYPDLISCHVVVEMVQKHHHTGNLHNVAIHAYVPGCDINISQQPNKNLYLAIQNAVDSLREQLESRRSQVLRDVKTHAEKLHGEIIRLFSNDDYGFIADLEENEYYFNLSHLVDTKFFQLHIGDKVKFIPAVGNEGLQARRISISRH